MNEDLLKPCPFCGENVNFISRYGIVGWHKKDCFFQFLENKYVDMTDEEIDKEYVKAWNRRTDG